MKYETKTTHEAKLSAETLLALTLWGKIKKTEQRLERLTEEHERYVCHIPNEDMEHYVRITTEE